jgi:hypothetical protein
LKVAAAVKSVDAMVGELVKVLKEKQLEDKVNVILTRYVGFKVREPNSSY